MTKIIKKQIRNIGYRQKSITWVLFSSVVIMLVIYGVLVNSTMANAVKKDDLSKQISVLNSEINTLEFEYYNVKNSITMDLALKEGFVVVKNQRYLSVKPSSNNLSLSINNENQ